MFNEANSQYVLPGRALLESLHPPDQKKPPLRAVKQAFLAVGPRLFRKSEFVYLAARLLTGGSADRFLSAFGLEI